MLMKFLLFRLMNKLRSSSIVRPDSRDDGFVRTSNITKFLAACSSYGLPNEDLFQRDDLIEATSESLARVAKTIVALIKYVDDQSNKKAGVVSPPRSPVRPQSPRVEDEQHGLFTWALNQVSSSPKHKSVAPDSRHVSDSLADQHNVNPPKPAASVFSAMTETTTTTMMSSLLDFSRSNRYGTIRSITTDATSEAPSITRTEGSFIAEDLARKRGSREPKLSESFIDPSRVEEMDEAGTTSRGMTKRWEQLQAEAHRPEKPAPAIRLGKGKWPDDFIEALSPSSPTSPQGPARLSSSSSSSTPSLRKLAIVGASKRNESVESLQHFPRRPSHRVRHSVDTPSLLPKDSIMRRESSPDGMPARSKVVIPRRNSAKPSLQRNGSLAPRSSLDESRDHSTDSLVPFPRTASGEYSASSTPPERTRPSRSRFESMMLGVALGNTSADDLLKRDSLDGSFVRQALIIREEGKPLAHFVSTKGFL
jgi:hypothetical protein